MRRGLGCVRIGAYPRLRGGDISGGSGERVDRDVALFGVKYEAAIVGGLQGVALERIEVQIAAELGEDWKSNPHVLHGRNAVRAEHGLPRLGEAPPPPAARSGRKSILRKIFGR